MIKILEDLLPSCMMDFGESLEEFLPLVEFAYNNNYLTNIRMTPFKDLYSRLCKSMTCWLEDNELLIVGPELLHDSYRMVELIQHRLLLAQDK